MRINVYACDGGRERKGGNEAGEWPDRDETRREESKEKTEVEKSLVD